MVKVPKQASKPSSSSSEGSKREGRQEGIEGTKVEAVRRNQQAERERRHAARSRKPLG